MKRDLQKEIDRIKRDWQELNSKSNQEKSILQHNLDALTREVSHLKKDISEKENQIYELDETVNEQHEELVFSRHMQVECNKILDDFRDVMSELKTSGDFGDNEKPGEKELPFYELRHWMRSCKQQESTMKDLREENARLHEEVEALVARMSEMESRKLSEHSDAIQEKELKVKIDKLQKKLDEKTRRVSPVATKAIEGCNVRGTDQE